MASGTLTRLTICIDNNLGLLTDALSAELGTTSTTALPRLELLHIVLNLHGTIPEPEQSICLDRLDLWFMDDAEMLSFRYKYKDLVDERQGYGPAMPSLRSLQLTVVYDGLIYHVREKRGHRQDGSIAWRVSGPFFNPPMTRWDLLVDSWKHLSVKP